MTRGYRFEFDSESKILLMRFEKKLCIVRLSMNPVYHTRICGGVGP